MPLVELHMMHSTAVVLAAAPCARVAVRLVALQPPAAPTYVHSSFIYRMLYKSINHTPSGLGQNAIFYLHAVICVFLEVLTGMRNFNC